MNTVLEDESPRVHSPWAKYIRSGLYLAVAAQISKREKAGKPLIPADAPIGYLPGDDITADAADKQAMQLAAACTSTITTDDMVVIAWVDGSKIALPDDANIGLRANLNIPFLCSSLLLDWVSRIPSFLYTDADRAYANGFLLKNSGNGDPGQTINPDTVRSRGDFRLFNRFRATFSVSNGQITNPSYLQSVSQIGSTPDPCGIFPAAGADAHDSNGAKGVTTSGASVYQLTEGRLGWAGRQINLTINGRTTPWIWSVIKFNASGSPSMDIAIFPTYSVYRNGQLFGAPYSQLLLTFIQKDETYQRLPGEIQ
jgi:hypothetical protein